MADSGTWTRARRAGRSFFVASRHAAKAGAGLARGTGRVVHRMTSASGAGRTGLSNLIELSAAASIGDAFVTIGLAGSLFFSASVDQARGRVTVALLVTIAPYVLLAPLIGPLLDRVRQGNRYILMGTLLARGLLCWGMAGAVQYNDVVTLLPAAFGVLILQKIYGVTRAAVTPRLLPSEITLVTANARANLASLVATSLGAVVALGVNEIMGGGGQGAAWVLRVGTVAYLAAMLLGFRLPERVDAPAEDAAEERTMAATTAAAAQSGASRAAWGDGAAAGVGGVAGAPGTAGPRGPTTGGGNQRPATRPLPARGARRGVFALPKLAPAAAEAIRANAAIRVFYGFMIFFLAFILRSEHFGHISDKIALGGLAVAIAAGGIIGTMIGSALRSRAPQVLIYTILGLSTVLAVACALLFSLWSVLAVALAAAISSTLVKVALDSILQRDTPEDRRSSAFAFSETLHQLALVGGGLLGLLLSLTGSGLAGLTVAAVGLALALCWLVLARRRRILRARPATAASVR